MIGDDLPRYSIAKKVSDPREFIGYNGKLLEGRLWLQV
jgi:hypothetical protein